MVNFLLAFIYYVLIIFFILFQCLCLIGEAFDHAEDVNGAVVNVRPKQDKVGKFKPSIIFNFSDAQCLH